MEYTIYDKKTKELIASIDTNSPDIITKVGYEVRVSDDSED